MNPTAGEHYHHGDLRRALIQAATDQLAAHPAHQLSLRELARTVGVSRTAPYHHFADKAALISAVAAECQERFYRAQLDAANSTTDAAERLVALGEAYVNFALDTPHAFALVFAPEHCPATSGSTAPDSPAMTALAELLYSLVTQAQADGVLSGDQPDAHISGLWSLVHGLSALVPAGLIPREAVPATLRAFVGG